MRMIGGMSERMLQAGFLALFMIAGTVALAGGRGHVIGHDDRVPLPSRLEHLNRAIGVLLLDAHVTRGRRLPSRGICTAACVAPRVLLTAAHCVMGIAGREADKNLGRKDMGRMIFLLPAIRRRLRLAGRSDAERRRLMMAGPGNVRRFDGNRARDWALLALAPETPCPASIPLSPLPPADVRLSRRGALALVAFHGDRVRRGEKRLFLSPCRAIRPRDRALAARLRRERRRGGADVLLHDCDAWPGASGGPILHLRADGAPRIVAVYSGSWLRRRRPSSPRRRRARARAAVNTAAPARNFMDALETMKRRTGGE